MKDSFVYCKGINSPIDWIVSSRGRFFIFLSAGLGNTLGWACGTVAAYTGPFSGGNKLVKESITAVGKYECIPQITVSQTEVPEISHKELAMRRGCCNV